MAVPGARSTCPWHLHRLGLLCFWLAQAWGIVWANAVDNSQAGRLQLEVVQTPVVLHCSRFSQLPELEPAKLTQMHSCSVPVPPTYIWSIGYG